MSRHRRAQTSPPGQDSGRGATGRRGTGKLPMPGSLLGLLPVLVPAIALAAPPAAGAPALPKKPAAVVEGTVINLQDGELVVDLGSEQGLPGDAVVVLYRRLEVTHPVTKKVLVDRFPIGKLRLTEVGRLLSIARDPQGLSRSPQPGDFVVYEPSHSSPVAVIEPIQAPADAAAQTTDRAPAGQAQEAQPAPEAAAAPPPPPRDPALVAIEAAFARTLGRSLPDRILVWEDYLMAFPTSPYLEQVGKELDWLRAALAVERKAIETPQPPTEPNRLKSYFTAPSAIALDEPAEWVVAVAERRLVEAVRVMARRAGDPSYDTLPMRRDGDFHWRVEVGEAYRKPGTVEYFIEAVRTNGKLELLVGDSQRPRRLDVEEPVRDAEQTADRSQATVLVEFVDFKQGKGTDEYFRIESDFRYRLDVGLLSTFSVGIGRFAGEGATVDDIAHDRPTSTIDVNYGYAEMELALGSLVGLSGRLTAGSYRVVEEEPADNLFGFRTELRIGEARGTHLTLGGSLTSQVGNEAWTELTLAVFRRMPMSASVVVTNLPVEQDLGVSLNYGLGWQATDWLALSLRLGWNARTINHYGYTIGSGAVLTW